MRVVILADFGVPSGGAQKVAIESARALAEQGVSITYLFGIGQTHDALLDHPLIQVKSFAFEDIWEQSLLQGLQTGLWNREAAHALQSVLDELLSESREATLFHLHQWTRSLSPAVFPVLLNRGVPVFITLHDYFLSCPNGLYYRFERQEPCDLRPLSAPCIAARCDPKSYLHKMVRVARTAIGRTALGETPFHVVHVSDISQRIMSDLLPPQAVQHRVDNPVGVEKASPAVIGSEARIAYIGRMTSEKGADLVTLAAKLADLPAIFIGDGPLKNEIARLNPEAEILDWRSSGEIAALLRSRVMAVAAPSRWYETGPLTVYEALAAGVPVIASTRCGAAEKVRHGESGLIVEPELGPLTAAFESLKTKDLSKMGAMAYDGFWKAPMTAKAHATRLIELYGQALAN